MNGVEVTAGNADLWKLDHSHSLHVMLCAWLSLSHCPMVRAGTEFRKTKPSFVEGASLGGFVPAMVLWQVR